MSGSSSRLTFSKRPPTSPQQEVAAPASLKDVLRGDGDSDLSDLPDVPEPARKSSINLKSFKEKLSPPPSPLPASQIGAPPTNRKRMRSLSQISAPAKASTTSAQKRPAGVENERAAAKKSRTASLSKSAVVSTRSKPSASSLHSLPSTRKTYKRSHKKPERLPTPPALSEQPPTDFDVIPNSAKAQPKASVVQQHSSPHRSPFTSEIEAFPSEDDAVPVSLPVPKKRGRASRIIDEDAGDSVPEADRSRALNAKVDFVEKPTRKSGTGEAGGASESKASVVKVRSPFALAQA